MEKFSKVEWDQVNQELPLRTTFFESLGDSLRSTVKELSKTSHIRKTSSSLRQLKSVTQPTGKVKLPGLQSLLNEMQALEELSSRWIPGTTSPSTSTSKTTSLYLMSKDLSVQALGLKLSSRCQKTTIGSCSQQPPGISGWITSRPSLQTVSTKTEPSSLEDTLYTTSIQNTLRSMIIERPDFFSDIEDPLSLTCHTDPIRNVTTISYQPRMTSRRMRPSLNGDGII